jgi:hypothetical protein
MVDALSLAVSAASLVVAAAALAGLAMERSKRLALEAGVKTLREAVQKIGDAVVQLNSIAGELSKGNSLANQAINLAKLNALVQGVLGFVKLLG